MAEYYKINGETLTAIADAIRAKKETTDLLSPEQMVTEIGGIESGSPSAAEITFGYVKKTETVTEKAPDGKRFYNGVLLPKIPSDVLANYPYVWIRKHTTNGEYQAMFSASGFYYDGSNSVDDKNAVKNPEYVLPITDGTSWTVASTSEGYSSWTVDDARPCMWSNHDIPNGSATATGIYFNGSEPLTELTETVTKLVPVERGSEYAVTSANLNDIAKRTQEMAGTRKLMTPEDIIYYLNCVKFIPQSNASSELTLEFDAGAVSRLPTVTKGTASSGLSITITSRAM